MTSTQISRVSLFLQEISCLTILVDCSFVGMQRYILKGIHHFDSYHVGSKVGSTTWLHHFVNQGSSRIQNFAKTFKETQLHAKVPKLFSVEQLKFTELRFIQNILKDMSLINEGIYSLRLLVNLNTTVSFSSVRHPFQR